MRFTSCFRQYISSSIVYLLSSVLIFPFIVYFRMYWDNSYSRQLNDGILLVLRWTFSGIEISLLGITLQWMGVLWSQWITRTVWTSIKNWIDLTVNPVIEHHWTTTRTWTISKNNSNNNNNKLWIPVDIRLNCVDRLRKVDIVNTLTSANLLMEDMNLNLCRGIQNTKLNSVAHSIQRVSAPMDQDAILFTMKIVANLTIKTTELLVRPFQPRLRSNSISSTSHRLVSANLHLQYSDPHLSTSTLVSMDLWAPRQNPRHPLVWAVRAHH